jgi:hypothetical protein
MKTIYIAGPMSGHYGFNFRAFDDAERELKTQGWSVINPAQMDRDLGFDPFKHKADAAFLADAMRRDVDAIIDRADAIALLPGWEKSTGATAEYALEKWKHIPAFRLPDMTPVDGEDVLEEALRLTRGDRQASYGPPTQDFARTAAMWSALKGVTFEPREVAMFMILLKMSREMHQRKRDNWVDTAGYARCGSLCD